MNIQQFLEENSNRDSTPSTPQLEENNLTHKVKNKLSRVLCVEDDPDITKIISLILQDSAKIWSAFTYKEAQELLETQPFDLVILDLKLPDGFGANLLPCINCETKKTIPVIVYSAYELDSQYLHLVKTALLKSKISNEKLLSIIGSTINSE